MVAWVQLTALGNPKLLERVSAGLVAIRNLFSQFDLNHDNVVSHEEFESVRSLTLLISADSQQAVCVLWSPRCLCSSFLLRDCDGRSSGGNS